MSVLWVPMFFCVATFLLYTLSVNFPQHTGTHSNSSDLKFPTNLEDLHAVANFLQEYKSDHYTYVLSLFICAYLYKQTFAIPGSVFMNVLAGALYGPWLGIVICCTVTSTGSTFCFLLSKMFGKNYIVKYFPEKIKYFQNMVEDNHESLFFFLLFVRLFPMSPNWFLNIASPIVNIPIHLFFLSVFIGLMPYIFICVQAGCFLSDINSLDDMFTVWTVAKLCAIAVVAALPGFLIKRYRTRALKIE